MSYDFDFIPLKTGAKFKLGRILKIRVFQILKARCSLSAEAPSLTNSNQTLHALIMTNTNTQAKQHNYYHITTTLIIHNINQHK